MRILFYQKRLQPSQVTSDGVHITEVLDHLSSWGNEVIYADGTHHSILVSSHTGAVSQFPRPETNWEKVKKFVESLPFRGEAMLSFNLLKEIWLFLSAFKTSLRDKPDLIYKRANLFNSEYLLSRILKIPYVKEINGLDVEMARLNYSKDGLVIHIIDMMERYNLPRADKHIVVTPTLKVALNKEYCISDSKIVVIENGANTNLFKPFDSYLAKRDLNLDTSISYICFVGALAVYHGVNDFISSMPYLLKEYPSVRALVIGEGTIKGELIKQSAQLGISDKVIFTGRIPYEKVPWYINASEICICPVNVSTRNRKVGASPLKLCEYLACGKPVVSSTLTGQEFLEENKCGFMVNTEDHLEFAQAVIKLLRDPILRLKMGENGRKYVLENRSWESVAKKVATVFESVIEEHKKSKRARFH